MSKFDTHGGYFAPKDYLKVNEGGSHEENPNGGVQIGVDPEGTPNLLEEGEPVYKDYVYSDNINAEREFLEQNHLPGKYEGKLYSKIADDILTEAEERPLDPISRNGLEALLGRLADAQEGQKQAKEQRDLEDELANLSPEELDQLEQMLAREQLIGTDNPMYGEGPVGAPGPLGISPEQMMGPAEPMPAEGMPMMKCGGKIARKFSGGGDVPPGVQRDPVTGEYYVQSGAPEILSDNVSGTLLFNPESGSAYNPYLGGPNDSIPMLVDEDGNLIDSIDPSVSVAFPGKTQAWVDAQVGPNSIRRQVSEGRDQFLDNAWEMGRSNLPLQFTPVGAGMNVLSMPSDIENEDWGQVAWDAVDAIPYAGKGLHMIGALSPLMRQAGRVTGPIGRSMERGIKKIGNAIKNAPGKLIEASGRKAMLQEARAVVSEAKAASSAARNTANAIADEVKVARANLAADPNNKALQQVLAELEARSAKADIDALKASAKTTRAQLEAANKSIGAFTGGPMYNRAALEKEVEGLQRAYESAKAAAEAAPNDKVLKETLEAAEKALEKAKGNWNKWWKHGEWQYKAPIGITALGYKLADDDKEKKQNWVESQFAEGGYMNQYPTGGWLDFLNRLSAYEYSKNRSNVDGKYAIDRRYDVWGGRNARQIEADKAYRDFTDYVIANPDDPNVQTYLRALDNGVAEGTPLLFNGDELVSGWRDLYRHRREDGNLGIYHLNPDDIGFLMNSDTANGISQDFQTGFIQPLTVTAQGPKAPNPHGRTVPEGLIVSPHPISWDNYTWQNDSDEDEIAGDVDGNPGLLPTWPRYAGAIGSGLLGLYNVFQSPDRYRAPRINPQLPEGRINLQNQVYNPIDQNMVANAQVSQGNSTNRALRNSGLGASTASAVLAADNNTTGNLGTGFLQTWDANNQRRNAVIAANNQAESQRANFDYTVDSARKQILNDAAVRNAQNDFLAQRLNYQAEGDKYTAISNQISNGLQALSGIGQENFAMNQVNTNPAYLGYRVGPNGAMFYNPNTGKWEKVTS